ncbi:MAG: DUF58 domain-containing protein [Bacteroidales bacterium]|nr:DUF58 domain-containing protein [Bacteroidales bacterium]
MIHLLKHITFSNRFFFLLGIGVILFASSFVVSALFFVALIAVMIIVALTITDLVVISIVNNPFLIRRETEEMLSLSDDNIINIYIKNKTILPFYLKVYDELPVQLQKRDFCIRLNIKGGQEKHLAYTIRPIERGEYFFGDTVVWFNTIIGMTECRQKGDNKRMVKVFPSILQMKQYELRAMEKISKFYGLKKLRKIGHSYEFETIKGYVRGDDYRAINWKATGRHNNLMVNVFEDEKAQNVYTVIDKSRAMMLPFNNLSLMDYAINTGLVITNTALHKHDKTGLITFSDKIGSMIKAEDGKFQLKYILDTLYKERAIGTEANYELLYQAINKMVKSRSLIFLYTNFESLFSAERVLPILRKINIKHLLVLVFFVNTEINDFGTSDAERLEDIYLTTVAKRFVTEKQQIVKMWRQFGIQVILTKPEELTIRSINKYLELKARGLI